MKTLNYIIIFGFFMMVVSSAVMGQTVTKLDGENMQVETVVTRKVSINRLREERDRLLWQQAESANRFNAVIYDLNVIISEFEKK